MSVVLLIWLIILKFLGFQDSDKAELFVLVVNLYYVLLFGLYVSAIRERKKKQRGYISKRDAFLTGLIITLFLVFLAPVSMAIFYYFINPNFFDTMIALSIEGGISEQIAQSDYNLSSYVFSSVIMNLVSGGLFSALGALLLQKIPNRQQYEPLA